MNWMREHAQIAELAPIIDGFPDANNISRIELEKLAQEFRTQKITFEAARDVFDQMKHEWTGSREVLLAQLVRIVEQFIRTDKISITPPLFYQDELRRRLIITLNMSRVATRLECDTCKRTQNSSFRSSTAITDSFHRGDAYLTLASPVSGHGSRTSMYACMKVRGNHQILSCWMTANMWPHGRRTII